MRSCRLRFVRVVAPLASTSPRVPLPATTKMRHAARLTGSRLELIVKTRTIHLRVRRRTRIWRPVGRRTMGVCTTSASAPAMFAVSDRRKNAPRDLLPSATCRPQTATRKSCDGRASAPTALIEGEVLRCAQPRSDSRQRRTALAARGIAAVASGDSRRSRVRGWRIPIATTRMSRHTSSGARSCASSIA
jgi:hypothetical protein